MLDGPKRMTTCGANYGAEVDAKSLRERELTASGKQYLMPEGWEQKSCPMVEFGWQPLDTS